MAWGGGSWGVGVGGRGRQALAPHAQGNSLDLKTPPSTLTLRPASAHAAARAWAWPARCATTCAWPGPTMTRPPRASGGDAGIRGPLTGVAWRGAQLSGLPLCHAPANALHPSGLPPTSTHPTTHVRLWQTTPQSCSINPPTPLPPPSYIYLSDEDYHRTLPGATATMGASVIAEPLVTPAVRLSARGLWALSGGARACTRALARRHIPQRRARGF